MSQEVKESDTQSLALQHCQKSFEKAFENFAEYERNYMAMCINIGDGIIIIFVCNAINKNNSSSTM